MKRTNHQMVVALLAASIDATKSLKKEIGMKHHILLLAVLLSGLLPAGTQAADAPLVQDPNFPLIRLPAEFDSHRTNILLITSEDNGARPAAASRGRVSSPVCTRTRTARSAWPRTVFACTAATRPTSSAN